MIRFFKIIALLEGLSLLILIFVAMPMKYIYEMPQMVRTVGMAHGILFIVYIILASMLKMEKDWPMKKYLMICLASVIPFGTFYIEKKYLKAT